MYSWITDYLYQRSAGVKKRQPHQKVNLIETRASTGQDIAPALFLGKISCKAKEHIKHVSNSLDALMRMALMRCGPTQKSHIYLI